MRFHTAAYIPEILKTYLWQVENISVTHIALGTVRVMRTGGMMGEVVGMAASLCKKHCTNPRYIYLKYLSELKTLMKRGIGKPGFPEAGNIN